jgi:hypothetical protein
MSFDSATLMQDFEVLRRTRETRQRAPWRSLLSWRRIEWALRWVFGLAPVAVTLGVTGYGYSKVDHDWRCVGQHLAHFAYGACVGWSILGSPRVASRRRRSTLLFTGVSVGLVLGTIVPAIQVAPTLYHNILGVAVLSLSLEFLNAAMLMALVVWFAGPISVTAFGIMDALRSAKALRRSPLNLTEAAWILLCTFVALIPALFSGVWPMPASV